MRLYNSIIGSYQRFVVIIVIEKKFLRFVIRHNTRQRLARDDAVLSGPPYTRFADNTNVLSVFTSKPI